MVKLGDVAGVQNGYAFKSDDFSHSGVPILKIKNVASGQITLNNLSYYPHDISKLKQFIVKYGDVLVSMTGSHISQLSSAVGKTARYSLEKESLLNQRVGKIYPLDDSIDNSFLWYLLSQPEAQLFWGNLAGGSANQANISPDIIKSFEFLLPPLTLQRKFAEFFNTIDQKITLLYRQNEVLENLAWELFKSKLITQKSSVWKEKGLDEIADFLNGLACQKYPPVAGELSLPVIKIKELNSGITEATDQATHVVPSQYIVEDGEILFSWSGSLELVIWNGGRGILNQHLFKVTSDHYPSWFYYFWIKYHLPIFRDIASDKATTMGHIQRQHLTRAVVIVPDDNTLEKLGSQISPLFTKLKSNLLEIRTLTLTRNLLLPKLLTGKIYG